MNLLRKMGSVLKFGFTATRSAITGEPGNGSVRPAVRATPAKAADARTGRKPKVDLPLQADATQPRRDVGPSYPWL
jgi:hypothetical protein